MGLLGLASDERGPRFKLIQEIHEDLARRHPLGIARVLSNVIDELAYGDLSTRVRIATQFLDGLIEDEERAAELCPLDVAAVAKTCAVAAAFGAERAP